MSVYYNEFDPKAAAWLRALMAEGLIPKGEVDERSIVDVRGSDLAGFTQCHFFAGIGGWAEALRLAGWGDRPVWTGSCPCQPWSAANVWQGGGRGADDERHLLPEFLRLIGELKPSIVLGEQVANAIKKGWLDGLLAGMEAESYACGVAVLPANAYRARHERKRVYFVADAGRERWEGYQPVECVPVPTSQALAINCDPLAHAGRALDGDYSGLLPCDGLSVQMERSALKGYGNAIVPQVAAEFIAAFMDASNG